MIVKSLMKFGDITTGATYAEQVKIEKGQVFECDDELAQERIERRLVVQATDEEARKYVDSIDTLDESDLKKGLLKELYQLAELTGNEENMSVDELKEYIKKLKEQPDAMSDDAEVSNAKVQQSSLLKESPYNELQEKAKELGLKYVGVSKENLIKSIKEYIAQQEELKKVEE